MIFFIDKNGEKRRGRALMYILPGFPKKQIVNIWKENYKAFFNKNCYSYYEKILINQEI